MEDQKIKNAINDKFMMNECNNFTGIMLKNKMDINTICGVVKEYQTKYLFIKSKDVELAQKFTMEMWWNCRGRK